MTTQWADTNTSQWVLSEEYSFISDYDSVFTYSFIFNDGIYAYSSYDNILDIYNIATQIKLASLEYNYYITSIFANNNNVFFGAKDAGVYSLNKDVLSNFSSNEDLYNATYLYKEYPDITCNHINFIHGNDACVSFCTTSGVDYFKLEPNGYRSYTNCSGSNDCFLLSERELFYTVSESTGYYICKVDPISNWEIIEPFISTNNNFLFSVTIITALKVIKNLLGETIVFISTDNGVGILNYNKNEMFYINNLLPEPIFNIVSIDVDNTTTNISGNLYITMRNHFLIVNLATMSITDMYTKDTAGKSLEKLDYEGIEKSSLN